MSKKHFLTRRQFVSGSATIIGGVSLINVHAASAQTKATQDDADYQATPKGNEKCSSCQFFEASAGTCQVVEGTVAAEGWCNLYNAAS